MKPLSAMKTVGAISLIAALTGCATADPATIQSQESAEVLPLEERLPANASNAEASDSQLDEPVLPDVARENTPQGAQATVKYFWEGIDYVRQTGLAQPAASVSHYLCDVCTEFVFRWQQLYDAGASAILDGETEVNVVETQSYVEEETQEEWTAVLFDVTEPASDFYMNGELVEDESLAETTMEGWWAELAYDESEERWKIEWIDQDDSLVS